MKKILNNVYLLYEKLFYGILFAMRRDISYEGCYFERLTFWVSVGVSFCVYLFSLGNGVVFGASNCNVVAATTWGISAPPGYPVWTLIGNLFSTIFSWVTWGGLPNPAWSISLFSAICGAWAVGIFAQLLWQVLFDSVKVDRNNNERWLFPYMSFVCCCVALFLAFSPLMWSSAVRATVETWEMLLFVGMLSWSYRFLRHPTAKVLGVLLFLFGLTLTNGMFFLWFGVPLLGMVFVAHRSLAKALLAFLIPIGLTCHLLSIGALPSAYEGDVVNGVALVRPMACAMHGILPLTFLPYWYYLTFAISLMVGVGSLFVWPRLSHSSLLAQRMTRHWWLGVFLASLLFFIVLLHAIVHTSYVISPFFNGILYSFLSTWMVHLFALAILWGLCWRFHRSRRYALAVTFVQVGLLFLYQHGFMLGLTHPRLWWFWWPLLWIICLFIMGRKWLLCGRGAMKCVIMLLLGILFYVYVPIVSLIGVSSEQWGAPFSWIGFHRLFEMGMGLGLPTKGTFIAIFEMFLQLCFGDGLGILFWGSVGLVIMGLYGVGRFRVRWLFFLIAWSLCCCLIFLLLPEVSLGFRNHFQLRLEVVFIFGFGCLIVIFSTRFLRRLEGPRLGWGCLGFIGGLLLFLGWTFVRACEVDQTKPIAPEARGHIFAWQWGAAALEGAPRLEDCLIDAYEPLPDPFWPPPLEKHSILLTSSYVPYYMTQSVGVRSDVKVFAHSHWSNELAQAVRMRRYPDGGILLPSSKEVETFQHCVHFKENDWLTNALDSDLEKLEVLLLHWFLERNSSVPIYFDSRVPYEALYRQLEPAGLSLKLSHNAPHTRLLGIRDVDFWDWYSRYLNHQPAYERDVRARECFSEMQRALAFVYRYQGQIHLSYRSLITSMSVYPIDSTTDYVEVFLLRALAIEGTKMSLSNFDNALRMLRFIEESDPENIDVIQRIMSIQKQKKALECCKNLQLSLNQGTISVNERCLYIEACLQLCAMDEAQDVARGFAEKFIPPAHMMRVVRLVLQLESPELLYAVAEKMPTEMYENLTERELLEIVKVALDYQNRPLAKSLLVEGKRRFSTSAALHWMKACYYYTYEDSQLAYHHLQLTMEYSPNFMDECSEEEKHLCREIEDRYQRLQEKGTRL